MAKAISDSGMFGVKSEAQALSLMLLCQAEGLHPVLALRRYHIVDGKPSMRADALQGEFEQAGAILWHERTEFECSASFFRDKRQVTPAALVRAKERYRAMKDGHPTEHLSAIGEMTIIRTFKDAVEKKVAMAWDKDTREFKIKHNWKQSPRQMLHARCLTEGVRAIAPGLIAGIYTEDEILDMPEVEASPEMTTAEDRVKQATANAQPNTVDAEIIPEIIPEINEVTEDNYSEVICHIGKAQGELLEKKVGEIHPKLLDWLQKHFGPGDGTRWGNPATPKDDRLKVAVDIALQKLNA